MELFERFNIEVAATDETIESTYGRRNTSTAARELLQAMSERTYSPNQDPAIRNFENRIRRLSG